MNLLTGAVKPVAGFVGMLDDIIQSASREHRPVDMTSFANTVMQYDEITRTAALNSIDDPTLRNLAGMGLSAGQGLTQLPLTLLPGGAALTALSGGLSAGGQAKYEALKNGATAGQANQMFWGTGLLNAGLGFLPAKNLVNTMGGGGDVARAVLGQAAFGAGDAGLSAAGETLLDNSIIWAKESSNHGLNSPEKAVQSFGFCTAFSIIK